MRVDSKGVQKALKQIPKKQRSYLFDAVRKSVNEGARLMRTMAPGDETAKMVNTKSERYKFGIRASVEAAPKTSLTRSRFCRLNLAALTAAFVVSLTSTARRIAERQTLFRTFGGPRRCWQKKTQRSDNPRHE